MLDKTALALAAFFGFGAAMNIYVAWTIRRRPTAAMQIYLLRNHLFWQHVSIAAAGVLGMTYYLSVLVREAFGFADAVWEVALISNAAWASMGLIIFTIALAGASIFDPDERDQGDENE